MKRTSRSFTKKENPTGRKEGKERGKEGGRKEKWPWGH
jgi:hypothetical protein